VGCFSFERLPPAIHQALANVPGLQRGRGTVRESKQVTAVPVELVDAALQFMPAPVAAMVRLQLVCGCRTGEVMRMRGAELNTVGPTWKYRPAHHKNAHRGLHRVTFSDGCRLGQLQCTRGRPGDYRLPRFRLQTERRLIMMWLARRLRG
jgi:integrase